MKLSRKEYKPQYNKKKEPEKKVPLTASQRALFMYLWTQELPSGKYAGKEAEWVYENDRSYWDWCDREGVLVTWGIMVLKDSVLRPEEKKVYSHWLNERTGEYYIGIREVLIACDKPAGEWLYERE